MRKLDPTLQSLLRRQQNAVRSAAPHELSEDDLRPRPERVDLAVMLEGDIADLQAIGFEPRTVKKHPTQGYTIATGTIAVARLEELEQLPHLVTTEASRPVWPELNSSVSEIRADQLHEAATPFKGAGVVVGVIDSGFDIHHQNFRKADETTRVLAIWDQTIDPGDADALPDGSGNKEGPPADYSYGVEYDEARINDALTTNRGLVRTNDRDKHGNVDGHGTHVTGIAAGDGSQAGKCRGAFTFVGVAPEAEIILVRLGAGSADDFGLGASTNLIDAFEWIWRHKRTAGKPIVVNLSMGDNMGAHDGTSLVELAIDIEMLVVQGHIVVKSAGNAGAAMQHAEGLVAPGATVEVGFTVRDRDGDDRDIDIWYDAADRFDLKMVRPGAGKPEKRSSGTFSPGGGEPPWVFTNVGVVVTSELNDPLTSSNRIHIRIEPGTGARIPAGPWRLRLTNTGATLAPFDAWIDRGNDKIQPNPPHHDAPYFTSHVTTARTISVPGTSEEVITVGNYAQNGFLFFDSTGDVVDRSSRGPTRDGRIKPEISAPGVAIQSAAARGEGQLLLRLLRPAHLRRDERDQYVGAACRGRRGAHAPEEPRALGGRRQADPHEHGSGPRGWLAGRA